MAIVPRLVLATGERRVTVRPLPGPGTSREVYAVARTASVRRPSVSAVLTALRGAAVIVRGDDPVGPAGWET